jgi:hypothetical protein
MYPSLIIQIIIDKTIKLWKVFERSIKVAHELNLPDQAVPQQLNIPKIAHQDNVVAAVPRRIYANGKYSLIPPFFSY